MAAENAEIEAGDTVAVWGCGPVGQFAVQSAWMLGAGRVIAIDRAPERLAMAAKQGRAEVINFEKIEGGVYDKLQEMTNGRGPDRCIHAVGAEAHGAGAFDAVLDKTKAAVMLATDRAHVLREAIMCRAKAERSQFPVSMSGCGQDADGRGNEQGPNDEDGPDPHEALHPAVARQEHAGQIDPSFIITHNRPLEEGPELYKTFRDKEDGCIKVVLKP